MSKPSPNLISAVSDTDLLSVSAVVIVESSCKYKGLNIRLISDWIDCCSNSKVYFHRQMPSPCQGPLSRLSQKMYMHCAILHNGRRQENKIF